MSTRVDQPHSAIGRDIARVMTVLARAVRARPLYAPNNEVLVLMMRDLERAFAEVLKMLPAIVLKVRPDSLLYDEEVVYSDPEVQTSLPFVLYRDGVRRLEFHRDLEVAELDVLLGAAQQGFTGRTLEDDVVSYLWRHQLHHIRYLTVDVSSIDAQGEADLDTQIDGLLRAIYGDSQDDVGPKSIHLDTSDLAAKSIALALDSIEEMAPGFHFSRQLPHSPAYGFSLLEEASRETDPVLQSRLIDDALEALSAELDPEEQQGVADALLRILDSTLLNEQLVVAARLVYGMRRLERPGPFLEPWLSEAASEARIRQVTSLCQSNPGLEADGLRFLAAWGRRAVPSLLGALPSFTNPEQRRRFADLAIELGIDDDQPLRQLLANEQGFVAREALYIMASLGQLRDRSILKEVQGHPAPQVRLALLGVVDKMPWDVAQSIITDLLKDPEARVQVAAAEELASRANDLSLRAIEHALEQADFDDQPPSVKRAFLRCYALLHKGASIDRLLGYIAAAEGWRVRRPLEETAEAATFALASLRSQAGVDALKKAALSRSKSIREGARAALERLKAGKP